MITRKITCPECGQSVTLPWGWVLGIEMVVRCRGCRRRFKTGYKMGAVLMALALTVSVALADLAIWLLGSWSTLIVAPLVVPGWIFWGFVARKWFLVRKSRKIWRIFVRHSTM
ncbi:hypothetical protein FACS1894159_10140 [Bacteroidia bacterium]|nr:hypothetical protein FACS1894159_10140 [Bacteroidia bacterium]